VVVVASYAFVTTVVDYASLFAPAASSGGVMGGLKAVLTVVASAFVAVFFTIPALLAMSGHGGAWVKHVVLKVWKHVSLALLSVAALYVGVGASISTVPGLLSPAVPPDAALAVVALAGLAVLVLGILPDGVYPAVSSLARVLPARGRPEALVELRQVPVARVRPGGGPEGAREEAARVQALTKTLGSLDGTTELVVCFREGRGRTLFVAAGGSTKADVELRLVSVLRAHLHGHRAEPCARGLQAPKGSYRFTIAITGAPEQVEDPLQPLARFFLQSGHEGEYRARVSRARTNPLRKLLASRRQRALARRSGHQQSEAVSFGMAERSTSVGDRLAEMEHEEAVKEVERRASHHAVKVSVSVTGYGSTPGEARRVAEGGASTLRGSLSSHRDGSALKARRVPDAERSPSSVLLPVEAAPYFWIPQVAMGSELAATAEFELSKELEGELEFGEIVLQSGTTGHKARIPLDALGKHLFVTGMTGSGKTTSCFNLLVQLHQLGIPFLVIEPVKSEYRALLAHVPGLQVFTLGDEDTAPFRLNIFEPPEGVKVQRHIESLEAAWNASFVMYAPLPYVLRTVLDETYRACGWDALKNKRGRPVTLHDFRARAQRVSRGLGYEPKVLMDIEAALKMRITSFALGGKGPMFDALSSIPLDDVLRRPTVLELKSITSGEEKAFVAALILARLAEYIESRGGSKQLRHVTLVEEAHRLLPNVSTQKGDPEAADPRRHTVEQFANMLAEFRALGEGLVVVEQIPTKILPDAIKNTATKLAHRVPAADDREVLAGAMNMTEEQSRVLTALQPGEAILSVEKVAFPIRIKASDAVARKGLPVGEVSDEWVKRQMTAFYLRNPLPKAAESFMNDEITSLVDSDSFEQRFRQSYREWLREKNSEPLCQLLISSAKVLATDDHDAVEMASRILPLAVAWYLPFDEEDRVKFPQMFMQKVRRSMRGDGRARR